MSIVFALIIIFAFNYSQAYPSGAPEDACVDMTPQHEEYEIQSSPSPVTLSTDKQSYSLNDTVVVKINGVGSSKFKGFLIMAKSPSSDDYLGTFDKSGLNKVVECSGGDAVTHKDNKDKTSVTLKWKVPQDAPKSLFFAGTVVQDFEHFWMLKTPAITIQ